MPAKADNLPHAQTQLLQELGERLRHARLRRKLTAQAVASRANVSRVTVHRAEHGGPAIAIGTLIKIMGVLDLASDVALLARDDRLGHLLQDDQLRPRRTSGLAKFDAPRLIRLERYPQLRQIAWHLGSEVTALGPQEAFDLYERNWRHVDRQAMPANEAALLKRLTASVGKGVLLV